MINLTKRQLEIFRAIVVEFINTAQPIGSKYLIQKYNWNYSSATIRNEMGVLEELGLLEKTHASSGRVPSTKGYQYYTQHVMMIDQDNQAKLELSLNQLFNYRSASVEEALKQSVNILSQMTNLTTGVLGPQASTQVLTAIDVIVLDDRQAIVVFVTNDHQESRVFTLDDPISMNDLKRYVTVLNDRLIGTPLSQMQAKMESLRPILQQSVMQYEVLFEAFASAFVKFAGDRLYFSGQNNLFDQPEFNSPDKLRDLLDMLENSQLWKEMCANREHLRIKTSKHSQTIWLDDMAVVTSEICLSPDKSETHQLMVVGPSRMHYAKVVSLVEYITKMIERVYGDKGE